VASSRVRRLWYSVTRFRCDQFAVTSGVAWPFVHWLPCPVLARIAYRLGRRALGLLAVTARGDDALLAEVLVLRQENAVLRRQVARVRYEPADRAWFAALSGLIPRARWAEVFLVTPATLLAWHRRLVAGKYTTTRRAPGRPSTAAVVKALILRMAHDNPRWGQCAVWRFVVFPVQPGGTRKEVLGSPDLPGGESRRGK
jgi:hypothetical protein